MSYFYTKLYSLYSKRYLKSKKRVMVYFFLFGFFGLINPNFLGFRIRINGHKLIRNSSDCRIPDFGFGFGGHTSFYENLYY